MSELPLLLRPLQLSDLPAVMAIEQEVFPLPWPASVYASELQPNGHRLYYALELTSPGPDHRRAQAISGGPGAAEPSSANEGQLVGYAGFLIIDDEAHLMTIAIAPAWQGRGLGEWLLLDLLDAMEGVGVRVATLEVRVGNHVARALYSQLGFRVEGRRRHYYSNNREDALIMTTPPLDSIAMHELRCQRRTIVGQRLRELLLPAPMP